MIRIRAVALDPSANCGRAHGFVWSCDCHPGLAPTMPWLDRPSEANATAEHDLVVGGRVPEAHGGWDS